MASELLVNHTLLFLSPLPLSPSSLSLPLPPPLSLCSLPVLRKYTALNNFFNVQKVTVIASDHLKSEFIK